VAARSGALQSPRGVLLGPKGWAALLAATVAIAVLVPLLNPLEPPSNA
jgi:urea transport system permease protein